MAKYTEKEDKKEEKEREKKEKLKAADPFESIQDVLVNSVKGIHVSTLATSELYNVKDDEWVSTPSYDLNRILSGDLHKGIPTRTLVGIVGPEASMKSSFMAIVMADGQKKGFIPIIIDCERGCDANFCIRWGIDPDKLKIIYAPYVDQVITILAKLLEMARTNGRKKFIIGLDSLGALFPEKLFDDSIKDDVKADQGLLQKSIKSLLKIFMNFVIETNSIGILTGHMYSRPGRIPLPDAVGGGKAFRLFPSILLSVKKEEIKENDEITGNLLTITSLKNRVTPAFQQANVSIDYIEGLDKHAGLLDYMTDIAGLIKKEGNTYSYNGEKIGVGYANASKALPKFDKELLPALNKWIQENKKYSQRISSDIKDAYEKAEADVEVGVKEATEETEEKEDIARGKRSLFKK